VTILLVWDPISLTLSHLNIEYKKKSIQKVKAFDEILAFTDSSEKAANLHFYCLLTSTQWIFKTPFSTTILFPSFRSIGF